MAQTIWKGTIQFGGFQVPVGFLSAVTDRRVHFRLLCRRDQTPVRQVMVHPRSGELVPRETIRRGIEMDDGVFVALSDDEVRAAAPEPSREIEITRFLRPEQIEPPWYARPYFLEPRGDLEGYFALAEALRRRERVGVARWVMRKKAYAGALRPFGSHLALIAFRRAEQVVSAERLPAPAGRPPDRREMSLAERLIAELEGSFELEAYRDEYSDRVRELVEARAEGQVIELERPEPPRPSEEELAKSLEASLKAAREARAG